MVSDQQPILRLIVWKGYKKGSKVQVTLHWKKKPNERVISAEISNHWVFNVNKKPN
jgi:hypothetical protein